MLALDVVVVVCDDAANMNGMDGHAAAIRIG